MVDEDYVICPTTGRKLNSNTLLPIEDHVDFTNKSLEGETRLQCQGFTGPCDSLKAEKRRRRTYYTNEEDNWTTQCEDCYEAEAEYWDEMWAEYYRERL